ncbi:MAG: ATP-binding cassette domain-containing protein [Deltaproteobacteria bacterium]|nr:ATP-binding cassette domain-containing protein [Deltaproteobacteria bacterium]
MIVFDNVYFQYEPEGIEALCGVSLTVEDGEHVAVVGPNGCGKTTLIRHINALFTPSKGSVTINGYDTQDAGRRNEIRQMIGMVFQNPDHQIVGMTVEEDCAFGPENLRLPTGEIRERVAEALDRVGIAGLAGRNIETLSGGEKRLAAIAGILAMRPRYIALDEPTAFLDPVSARLVLEMIDKLHSDGVGIIHITHNMAEAAGTERIIVMNKGSVYFEGTPQVIFRNVDKLKTIGISLPQITELLIRLRESGLPVRTDIGDMDGAVSEIKGLINK